MTSTNYAVYNDATGQIVNHGYAPASMVAVQAWEPGTSVIPLPYDPNPDTEYVVPVEGADPADFMTPRPAMSLTVGATTLPADSATPLDIAGIPVGTLVSVSGPNGYAEVTVDDGDLQLTFDTDGPYEIKLTMFPYIDETVEVTAT